jgi:hypothetical protein
MFSTVSLPLLILFGCFIAGSSAQFSYVPSRLFASCKSLLTQTRPS